MTLPFAKRGRVTIKESPQILAQLNLLVGELLKDFYKYNELIKERGFYLKPVHIVTRKLQDGSTVKYYYYGRYWYRLEKTPTGRIKWVYVGRTKPIPELPDPPENPLEGLVVKVYNDVVEIVIASEEMMKLIYSKLASSRTSS
jgi:hypothetical protein